MATWTTVYSYVSTGPVPDTESFVAIPGTYRGKYQIYFDVDPIANRTVSFNVINHASSAVLTSGSYTGRGNSGINYTSEFSLGGSTQIDISLTQGWNYFTCSVWIERLTTAVQKVNVGGTWKQATGEWVNIGGTWKPVAGMWVNVNGVWKQGV